MVVVDGGIAGRARVEEGQGAADIGKASVAGRAAVEERHRTAKVGGKAWHVRRIVDDAGAVERKLSTVDIKGISRRSSVELHRINRVGTVRVEPQGRRVRAAERRCAGGHHGCRPVGGGIPVARSRV